MVPRYDFTRFGVIAHIGGGGRGHLLRAVLSRHQAPQECSASRSEATDIDVSMLALMGRRERTPGEYTALLARSGWRVTGTVPTPVHTIIQATPALGMVNRG